MTADRKIGALHQQWVRRTCFSRVSRMPGSENMVGQCASSRLMECRLPTWWDGDMELKSFLNSCSMMPSWYGASTAATLQLCLLAMDGREIMMTSRTMALEHVSSRTRQCRARWTMPSMGSAALEPEGRPSCALQSDNAITCSTHTDVTGPQPQYQR